MANEITGASVQVIEIDLDVYRATQFELDTPYEATRNWTKEWDADCTLVCDLDRDAPSGKTARFTVSGSAAAHFFSFDLAPEMRDASAIVQIKIRDIYTSAGIMLRGSGAAGSETGYECTIKDGDTIEIYRWFNGTATLLTSSAFAYEPDDVVWLRFDAIDATGLSGEDGVTVRAKAWLGDMEDEPQSFMLAVNETNSPSITAGKSGLFLWSGEAQFGFFRVRSYLSNVEETLRFAVPTKYLPVELDAIPNVEAIDQTPATLSLGENLGERAQVNITFRDHKHAENGEFFHNGTFWARFRARQLFRRGQPLRVKTGLAEHDFNDYEIRHYYLDKFDGLGVDNTFSIVAQDILKFVDNERAQAPRANSGFLVGSLAADGTSFTVGPTGIGNIEYPSSGYVAIGGKEIVAFTRSGDTFTIAGGTSGRAQFGTEAIEHSGEDRIQLCLYYNAMSPADILYDLFTEYAGIDPSAINLTAWQTECDTYLNRLYGRLIAEPTGVEKLASDLIQQAGLIVWWDNIAKEIKLQVLRGIVTNTYEYNEENTIAGSIDVQEQRDKMITEVWTYYGVRNPLESLEEATNYRSSQVLTNGEAATLNGSALIKKIYGTWIPAFGSNTAERTNDLHAGRFLVPPRRVTFSVPRHAGIPAPVEAGGYRFRYRNSQNEHGAEADFPIQVIRVQPHPDRFDVEAEEMLFRQFDPSDLVNRVITVDSDINNFNLKTVHDSIYPPITTDDIAASPTISLTCIVSAGVIIGSTNISNPAFDTGLWPSGFVPFIIIRGRVQGKGGDGGYYSAGQNGGIAFRARCPIRLQYTDGDIWGGGGGGGSTIYEKSAWRGGGGAGTLPGQGGSEATPATSTSGGNHPYAGDGGGPGQNGGAQVGTVAFYSGGSAGVSIKGTSFITQVGAAGDRRGPTQST